MNRDTPLSAGEPLPAGEPTAPAPDAFLEGYARLLVHGGVRLQPGQALQITAEIAHRDFVRRLVAEAYDTGARYVRLRWLDPLSVKARFRHIRPEYLDFVPGYEEAGQREILDEGWAILRLTGEEYPGALEDVDPALMRREQAAWSARHKFYKEAVMNNAVAWCVAAVPTPGWARRVFPDLEAEPALRRLWSLVLGVCRADRPDPLQAWAEHDAALKRAAAFMDRHRVRVIRYLDEAPGPDGRPSSDLTVGLTDRPAWAGGSSVSARGLSFYANIPTEELFSTPHNRRTRGWVRTSRPAFPFEREVSGAWFRFEEGELVEWRAEKGREVLDELFRLAGARRLGELSLVDVRSPVHRAGVTFHETLFDENAACHIAFGQAYPEGVQGGEALSRPELNALGVNESDAHEDFMIGTPTMRVIGTGADGRELPIMENGRFVEAVLGP